MEKLVKSDDNEDILGEYLAEDPSVLTDADLRSIAETFGLPVLQVKAIAAGMSRVRAEVKAQYGEHE